MSRSSSRRRRGAWVLGILAGLLAAYIAAAVSIYAAPDDAYDPHRIDAVFILGPPTPARIAAGERIANEAGGVPVYLSVWRGVVCEPRFVCVHADPWTTTGEAAALRKAVRDDGVTHPLVLTSREHVLRARYIFGQCVPIPAPVTGIDEPLDPGAWLWQPIYQWARW